MLSFLLEDILVLSGRVKSRGKIQTIEIRKIDTSYQFMYLPKFQLSNDEVLREKTTPSLFMQIVGDYTIFYFK